MPAAYRRPAQEPGGYPDNAARIPPAALSASNPILITDLADLSVLIVCSHFIGAIAPGPTIHGTEGLVGNVAQRTLLANWRRSLWPLRMPVGRDPSWSYIG